MLALCSATSWTPRPRVAAHLGRNHQRQCRREPSHPTRALALPPQLQLRPLPTLPTVTLVSHVLQQQCRPTNPCYEAAISATASASPRRRPRLRCQLWATRRRAAALLATRPTLARNHEGWPVPSWPQPC